MRQDMQHHDRVSCLENKALQDRFLFLKKMPMAAA
jgi:hypothetical protein